MPRRRRDNAPVVSNEEKRRVWQAYRDGAPVRVPVELSCNARVVVLDPAWNRRGISFEEYFKRADAAVEVQLALMDYRAEYLNRYRDAPLGRPAEL